MDDLNGFYGLITHINKYDVKELNVTAQEINILLMNQYIIIVFVSRDTIWTVTHVSPLKLSLSVNASVGKYILILFTLESFLLYHQINKYIYIYILFEIEFYSNII